MRALVTGGAGFIGSHVTDALAARGDDVLVVDDLSTGRKENVSDPVQLERATIADAAAIHDVVQGFRSDVVFHLAAQVDVRRSVANPPADAGVNVEGTLNVLAAAHAEGTTRVVFSSTGGALYGDAQFVPTPEDAPILPLSPYGQAKYAAEGYVRLFGRPHGMDTAVLRYANVFGPRQDPFGEGGVVAIFCDRATKGARATVYGDGRQTRDFVYVGDVVKATLLAADAPSSVPPVNIGTGEETSVLALAAALGGLSVDHAPARAGEVRRSCLDPRRAERALGWRPKTSLDDGLRATLRGGPC
jgi:UDP-glucose 4-epimerase